jgi:hypothetical protein
MSDQSQPPPSPESGDPPTDPSPESPQTAPWSSPEPPAQPPHPEPGPPVWNPPPPPDPPQPPFAPPQPAFPAPGFVPAPGPGAPPPGYGAPPPGYPTPQPGYGAPPPGYGAPPPGYGYPPQYGQPAIGRPARSKTAAVLLAVFLTFWSWLYTWRVNKVKFLIGLGLEIGVLVLSVATGTTKNYAGGSTFHFGLFGLVFLVDLGVWIWAIVDNATKDQNWYASYPGNQPPV